MAVELKWVVLWSFPGCSSTGLCMQYFVRWTLFLELSGLVGLSLAMPQLGFEKRARLGHLGRKTRLPGASFMEHLPIEGPGI